MAQKNAIRVQFEARETLTSSKVDDIQDMAQTCFFQIGDTADHVIEDANGNITIIDDNLTITGIVKDQSVTLSAAIDTTTPGTHRLRNQEIDDVQSALARIYCFPPDVEAPFTEIEPIEAQELNAPGAGQTRYDVANVALWRAGDKADIISDSGLLASDVNVDEVKPNADDANNKATIVIDSLVDISAETNPILVNKTLNNELATRRNQERIDEIDKDVLNENMHNLNGIAEGTMTVYETQKLFRQGSTLLRLGGSIPELGTRGTPAELIQGTYPGNNDSLKFTSILTGLLGNEVEVEVVSAAGLTVTTTTSFKASASQILSGQTQYLIQVNNNSGAATAKDIADAINSDPTARRIAQAQYGGDGSGAVAAFGPTNLAGGLDDGTEAYCEIEQIFENKIVNTGYKFVSFHIRPNERDKMDRPPKDDERVFTNYKVPLVNIG